MWQCAHRQVKLLFSKDKGEKQILGPPAISVTRKLNLGLSHSRGPLLHQFYYTAFPKKSAIATEVSIRLKVPCGQP